VGEYLLIVRVSTLQEKIALQTALLCPEGKINNDPLT
jgi:hypothetical protein